MSNTSTLSPYGACLAAAGAAVVGVALIGISVGKWLATESEADRKAVERLRQQQRNDRIRPLEISSVELHTRNLRSLMRSAKGLGYQVHEVLDNQARTVLLRRSSGERLAIRRALNGRLSLHTMGGQTRITDLVRQHTLDQTLGHLARIGMETSAQRLRTGEVQIVAREKTPLQGPTGGKATMQARVQPDGRLWVDVEPLPGARCEEIVRGLAESIEARVTETRQKSRAFQLPGEPARNKVRA